MTATRDTTTTTAPSLDMSNMNEEELTKLHDAAAVVIETNELCLADLTDWADDIVAGTAHVFLLAVTGE